MPTIPPLNIVVTFENTLPNAAADAEQFLNNASALSTRDELNVTLVIAKPTVSEDELRNRYQLNPRLMIEIAPSASRSVALQHAKHALYVARRPVDKNTVVYTRNMAMLLAVLCFGHRTVFEHYRAWCDQIPPLQALLRYCFLRPQFLGAIFHSEFARASYLQLGTDPHQMRVFHNGYNPSAFQPVLTKEEARSRTGLPLDRRIVMYAGRVNHKKGLDVVLDAARLLPEALFVLVGSEGQGEIEVRACSQDNVKIVSWLPAHEAAKFLYAADVLTIPPSSAPLQKFGSTVVPLKVFNYVAAARPILAPDGPDIRELLVDGENALLVPADDPAAMAEALRGLFSDQDTMKRLSERCALDARELTWANRARRIAAFLQGQDSPQSTGQTSRVNWDRGNFVRGSVAWIVSALRGELFLRTGTRMEYDSRLSEKTVPAKAP